MSCFIFTFWASCSLASGMRISSLFIEDQWLALYWHLHPSRVVVCLTYTPYLFLLYYASWKHDNPAILLNKFLYHLCSSLSHKWYNQAIIVNWYWCCHTQYNYRLVHCIFNISLYIKRTLPASGLLVMMYGSMQCHNLFIT